MKRLVLLLAILFSPNSFACSCAEKPSVKDDWAYSNEVLQLK
jgi:hypothetical protein